MNLIFNWWELEITLIVRIKLLFTSQGRLFKCMNLRRHRHGNAPGMHIYSRHGLEATAPGDLSSICKVVKSQKGIITPSAGFEWVISPCTPNSTSIILMPVIQLGVWRCHKRTSCIILGIHITVFGTVLAGTCSCHTPDWLLFSNYM